jgi:hypothetical protein
MIRTKDGRTFCNGQSYELLADASGLALDSTTNDLVRPTRIRFTAVGVKGDVHLNIPLDKVGDVDYIAAKIPALSRGVLPTVNDPEGRKALSAILEAAHTEHIEVTNDAWESNGVSGYLDEPLLLGLTKVERWRPALDKDFRNPDSGDAEKDHIANARRHQFKVTITRGEDSRTFLHPLVFQENAPSLSTLTGWPDADVNQIKLLILLRSLHPDAVKEPAWQGSAASFALAQWQAEDAYSRSVKRPLPVRSR